MGLSPPLSSASSAALPSWVTVEAGAGREAREGRAPVLARRLARAGVGPPASWDREPDAPWVPDAPPPDVSSALGRRRGDGSTRGGSSGKGRDGGEGLEACRGS